MKHLYKLITQVLVIFVCSFFAHSLFAQVTLTGTSYTQDFDAIGSGLPTGWTVRTGASATSLGTTAALTTAATLWNNTSGAFKNFASGDIGAGGTQASATDRALGVRQSSSVGDPGAAFTLQLSNTTGFSAFAVSFKLQSLDASSPRTVTWALQVATGAAPTSFTTVSTNTATTGGSLFSNNTITATLPSDINNISDNVWVRVVTLTTSTGSGNRPSSAIDDFTLTYSSGGGPYMVASPTTISTLQYVETFGPSPSLSYTLSAGNLTPAAGSLAVAAPTNFEISTDNITFSDNLNIPYTGGNFPSTVVRVRLKAGLALNTYGGDITNSGGGATNALVTLTGNVVANTACPGTITDIATLRTGIPAQASYTGTAGSIIQGTVTGVFGANKFYLKDATGGIAVFQTNVVTTNNIQIGNQVRLVGTPVRFNGEAQLNTVTCFTTLGGGNPITPLVFDSNTPPSGINLPTFLSNNEGDYVKIISANITTAGSYGASTNYTVQACNSQGGTEIRIDAGSVGLIGNPVPTVSQDITGVVGRFITANGGTDKIQVFPRTAADITPASVACTIGGGGGGGSTGCSVATVTNDPAKLDVVTWNIEWLGHAANGPSSSGTADSTQLQNARLVLNAMGADVFILEEICGYTVGNPTDPNSYFGRLLIGLNNTFGVGSYSGECSSAVSGSVSDPTPQRVCIVYRNSVVQKVSFAPMFTGFVANSEGAYPTGNNSQFWASGRYPFVFEANVTLPGQTAEPFVFVGLHAKAGSDATSYQRRRYDVRSMYDHLQTNFPTSKIVIGGDLNDDVDVSINAGSISSYRSFLYQNPTETNIAGTRPSNDWDAVTKPLSDASCASTATFPDFIDHFIISRELMTATTGLKYTTGSATNHRPNIANYAGNTSDHYPTLIRLEPSAAAAVMSVASGNWSSPSTWNCNCVPTASQNVTVKTGHTVTVDAASVAKNLDIETGGNVVFSTAALQVGQ
jgi:hypothetical protein